MTVYATATDLTARLSDTYSTPANAAQLLLKASELIDEATLGRAQTSYDAEGDPDTIEDVTGVAATDVLTAEDHGLSDGRRVRFTELTGGAGLAVATDYWVRDQTADTFKLSATVDGAAVNFTTDITAATVSETPTRDLLRDAVCDQVEFWIEVGEETDVVGLKGSMVAGRVQIHPVPPQLGQRARRTLRRADLMYLGVNAR